MLDRKRKYSYIRRINRWVLLTALRKEGPIDIAGLVTLTSLSKPTVMEILNRCVEERLVSKAGMGEYTGGRRPQLYSLNPHYPLVVGVELEIPRVRLALANVFGEIVARDAFHIDVRSDASFVLSEVVERIRQLSACFHENVAGIGVCTSGFFDPKQGVVRYSPRIEWWRDVPVLQVLQRELKWPVSMDNHADAHARAEKWFGAARSEETFFYIGLMYGLSTAAFISGAPYSGPYGNAVLMAHTVVEKDGRECVCGNRGCLEAYVSASALSRRIREARDRGTQTVLSECEDDRCLHHLIEARDNGDELARRILDEMSQYLVIAVYNAMNIYQIPLILLGGDLRELGEPFLRQLTAEVTDRLPSVLGRDMTIRYAALPREDVGVLGAAACYLERIFGKPKLATEESEWVGPNERSAS